MAERTISASAGALIQRSPPWLYAPLALLVSLFYCLWPAADRDLPIVVHGRMLRVASPYRKPRVQVSICKVIAIACSCNCFAADRLPASSEDDAITLRQRARAPENVAVHGQFNPKSSVALRPERPLQRRPHLVEIGGVTVEPTFSESNFPLSAGLSEHRSKEFRLSTVGGECS